MWEIQFKAYAAVYGFSKALESGFKSSLSGNKSDALVVGTDDAKILAKKKNMIAMASLTASFTQERDFAIAYKAKTKEWPSGLAYLVMEGLAKKYKPKDMMTRVEMKTELNKISMKDDESPMVLEEKLNTI